MLRKNKISIYKVKKILSLFCEDVNATAASKLLNINRNTINKYYNYFRKQIYRHQTEQMEVIFGEFEADESYFGASRVRGKRGRGAGGKIPVFGLLKRDGKVFVQPIIKASKSEILPLIKKNVKEGSMIYTDSWKAYDGLIFDGYKHQRIKHSENEFANGKNHINGIESFWSFSKRRISKFNGILKHKFEIHLKECEFRFNNRKKNIFKEMLKVLKIK
jgi:transposase